MIFYRYFYSTRVGCTDVRNRRSALLVWQMDVPKIAIVQDGHVSYLSTSDEPLSVQLRLRGNTLWQITSSGILKDARYKPGTLTVRNIRTGAVLMKMKADLLCD